MDRRAEELEALVGYLVDMLGGSVTLTPDEMLRLEESPIPTEMIRDGIDGHFTVRVREVAPPPTASEWEGRFMSGREHEDDLQMQGNSGVAPSFRGNTLASGSTGSSILRAAGISGQAGISIHGNVLVTNQDGTVGRATQAALDVLKGREQRRASAARAKNLDFRPGFVTVDPNDDAEDIPF